MSLEIFDCEQGSSDWLRCRLGLPTASRFGDVLSKGKGATESLTRARYLRTLAAEIITGEPGEEFSTPAIERGKAMEAEARRTYAFVYDATPELIGFVKNGRAGCSPDALLGKNGLLEIKTKRGDILIEALLKDEVPPEHMPQIQGALWVTEREFCDLVCYWPGLPLFVKKVPRNEKYIGLLAAQVSRFCEELDAIVDRVKRYGTPLTQTLKQSLGAS